MNEKVVSLHVRPREIAHYIHLGHHSHRMLETLLVSGGLPVSRAVVDAAHLAEQRELVVSLKQHNAQVVLDTRSMELGTPGGCTSARKQLPWARNGGHWTPDALTSPAATRDLCQRIAEFAVMGGVDVVQAPTHLHETDVNDWLKIDLTSCEQLRIALDRTGGKSIAIDYPLISSFAVLQNETLQEIFIDAARSLPFENLWLRAAGFGIHATAARIGNFIRAASSLTRLGKALVIDSVGGFPALTALAFGVAGGVAHGISNQNEQFNSYPLRHPSERTGGGSSKWVYLASIDQYVKAKQLDSYLAVRGFRAQLLCNDPTCCPHGVSSMKNQEKRHALRQRVKQLHALSNTPEHRRPEHLLRSEIQPAGQKCRALERLLGPTNHPQFQKQLRTQSHRMDDLGQMIEKLSTNQEPFGRSIEPVAHHSDLMPIASGY